MLTISKKNKSDKNLSEKISKFNESISKQPLFFLLNPIEDVYKNELARKSFEGDIGRIIGSGLINLEIPWKDHENWLDLMSGLKSKFPSINLGSASVQNKKSIDDSLKVGLDFSMMKFWQKDLFLYSRKNNYLLIPGLNRMKDLREVSSYNCQIVKIYPIKNKDKTINLNRYKTQISFIAAGGLGINDLDKFISCGYKAIVVGSKGYNGKIFDSNIIKWIMKLKK